MLLNGTTVVDSAAADAATIVPALDYPGMVWKFRRAERSVRLRAVLIHPTKPLIDEVSDHADHHSGLRDFRLQR